MQDSFLYRGHMKYENQSGAERLLFILFKLRRRNCQKGKKMETIISACISAAVTLVVCVISNNAQQEKTRTLMEYKLEELTKRVNEHNNLIKRTYALEEKMSVHEEQIKVANHRIEDLEKKGA